MKLIYSVTFYVLEEYLQEIDKAGYVVEGSTLTIEKETRQGFILECDALIKVVDEMLTEANKVEDDEIDLPDEGYYFDLYIYNSEDSFYFQPYKENEDESISLADFKKAVEMLKLL